MFERYGYLRDLRHVRKTYEKKIAKAVRDVGPESEAVQALISERNFERQRIHLALVAYHSERMAQEAFEFDVALPVDEEYWLHQLTGENLLNFKGRALLRKQIDEEKIRRRDVRAWWWKNLVIPGVTVLIGLVGAITGLIAVIHSNR